MQNENEFQIVQVENGTRTFQVKKIIKVGLPLFTVALIFVVQPVFRTLYHPAECGIVCLPPLQNILVGLLIFVCLPLSIWFLIPTFSSKSYHQLIKLIAVAIIVSVILPSLSTISDYPYSIYREYTRPIISILSPTQSGTLETGKKYIIRWSTKNIGPDETVQIAVSYNPSNGAVDVDTLGPVKNTGSTDLTLDPKIVKSGPVSINISYPGDLPWGGVPNDIHQNPRGAMTTIALNANNPNNNQLVLENSNNQLPGDLLAFKRAALEEANRTNNYVAVCKTKLINTDITGMKAVADSIVSMKIGAQDQISAGINCFSNDISFGLSIPLNPVGTSTASSICISGSKFPNEKPLLYYPQRLEIVDGKVTKKSANISYAIRDVYECNK